MTPFLQLCFSRVTKPHSNLFPFPPYPYPYPHPHPHRLSENDKKQLGLDVEMSQSAWRHWASAH